VPPPFAPEGRKARRIGPGSVLATAPEPGLRQRARGPPRKPSAHDGNTSPARPTIPPPRTCCWASG